MTLSLIVYDRLMYVNT